MDDLESKLNLAGEMERAFAGILAIGKYVSAPDDIVGSIAVFSAKSDVAREGEAATYSVKLVNNAREHQWFNLVVEIDLKEKPGHLEDHFAHFGKHVFIPARSALEFEFTYDWREQVVFRITGCTFPADMFGRAPKLENDTYVMRLSMRTLDWTVIEEVFLTQRLTADGSRPDEAS